MAGTIDKKTEKKVEKKDRPKIQFGKYFRETRAEMKKVTWPTRKELIQHTGVVLSSIVIIGSFIWIADLAMGEIVTRIVGK